MSAFEERFDWCMTVSCGRNDTDRSRARTDSSLFPTLRTARPNGGASPRPRFGASGLATRLQVPSQRGIRGVCSWPGIRHSSWNYLLPNKFSGGSRLVCWFRAAVIWIALSDAWCWPRFSLKHFVGFWLNHPVTSRGYVAVPSRRKALKKRAKFRAQPIAGPGDSVKVQKRRHSMWPSSGGPICTSFH